MCVLSDSLALLLQLPPTILSAKQKLSDVKVKIKPLDFPELPSASNGEDSGKGPAETGPTAPTIEPGSVKPDETPKEETAAEETIMEKTETLAIDENGTTPDSPVDSSTDDQNEDPESSSDNSKDDMREDNVSVKRTKLSPPRTLETTLFDRLEKMYGAGIKRLLAVQYR